MLVWHLIIRMRCYLFNCSSVTGYLNFLLLKSGAAVSVLEDMFSFVCICEYFGRLESSRLNHWVKETAHFRVLTDVAQLPQKAHLPLTTTGF